MPAHACGVDVEHLYAADNDHVEQVDHVHDIDQRCRDLTEQPIDYCGVG